MNFTRAAIYGCAASLATTQSWLPKAAGAAEASEVEAAATAAAPKDYVVFFGLDVFADDGARPRPVVDMAGNNVVLRDEEGVAAVSPREVRLNAEVAPKLSRTGVTITDLEGAPVYSTYADPRTQERDQQMMISSLQDQARNAADVGYRDATNYRANAARSGDAATMANAEQKLKDAGTRLDDVNATPVLRGAQPGDGADAAAHDGFEISFRVSAPEPHAHAYGVVRLLIRAPQQSAATLQELKVFRLPELTSKPRRTVVSIYDVPPGFTVESYEVHIYADGAELATNLSSNRVELTVDEAHQYLILRHIHLNRGASIPAQVLAELAHAAPADLIAGQEDTLVNLGITVEGRVAQVDGHADISPTLSPPLQAALREVRFLPALVGGQPAASTGTFALGELFLSP